MKAAYFRQHGGPQVMEFGEMPQPSPGPGEALVRVRAASLNRVDKWTRDGYAGLKLPLPHIPGSDGAGEVAEGAGLFQPGDRVAINTNIGCGTCEFCVAGQDNLCQRWHLLGETRPGTDAEYVTVPERQLLALPETVSFEQAAAAGLVFQTAWHSLITRGRIQPGETVLVVGAAGGVNSAAIQIAKLAGCRVMVVGSNAGKLALAEALGADVLIDRSQVDWGKQVYQLTNKRGVDVVVDNVGGPSLMTSLRSARKGGRILTVGNTAGPKLEFDNRYMFAKGLSLLGSTMSTRAEYAAVMALIFAGRLKPVIDRVFPLAEIQAAHQHLEQGEVLGKIILTI
ncbi:MAG: zinc-binding dehydrogenase [Anaerolineales bacterium]